MDLVQKKLTRSEWNSIEVSLTGKELKIINMIKQGYSNPDIIYNDNVSMSNYLKIKIDSMSIDHHLYQTYFEKDIKKIITKYNLPYIEPIGSKKLYKINTPDLVRLNQNTYESIRSQRDTIMEYVYIQLIEKFYKHKVRQDKSRWMLYYYTIYELKKSTTILNNYVDMFIKYVIDDNMSLVSIPQIIEKFNGYIEKNSMIYTHSDNTLYSHQTDIFKTFSRKDEYNHEPEQPKLILYIAPTSTGKTLTPIGLSEKYRVIFVCAARHVGINLARASISSGKKVAFGFGCESADEIRLHYHAATSFVKHEYPNPNRPCVCGRNACKNIGKDIKYRDGKKKVDNSDGSNVEIMICDIVSYKHAMYYMKSFNRCPDEDDKTPYYPLITFWDEPTITMDYETHPCHEIIEHNWSENIIPNIVLSSATLPKEHEIGETIRSFRNKFGENSMVKSIISHDCKKTIPIYDTLGNTVVPHLLYDEYRKLLTSVSYIKNNRTLLRYVDLDHISAFIKYANEHAIFTDDSLKIENRFKHIDDVSVQNIKIYYIDILENIRDELWSDIYNEFKSKQTIKYPKGGVLITSDHAATLTDGPTIFITEEPEKIAKFYLSQAKIPKEYLENINRCIEFNNTILRKISDTEKTIEDKMQKYEGMENKLSNIEKRVDPDVKELIKKVEMYRNSIKSVKLPDVYIPNSRTHFEKFNPDTDSNGSPFTSKVGPEDVERIMAIDDLDDIWKVLLIMGIGLFSQTNNITYTEIVKDLAERQCLYLIIAKGDYIYGTNYQFCHGFLSKDLTNMTQEKIIQAIGRIGRSDIQKQYSVRFRNNDMIYRLFNEENDKVEVKNMNRLFS